MGCLRCGVLTQPKASVMPALDNCQTSVIRALEKEGGKVLVAPLYIAVPNDVQHFFMDLCVSVPSHKNPIFVVEIKCFDNPKKITQDWYVALGHLTYREALELSQLQFTLFLAIPKAIYLRTLTLTTQSVIQTNRINLLVVDFEEEVVWKWIESP